MPICLEYLDLKWNPSDSLALATEIWEGVLVSVSKTLQKQNRSTSEIVDLDAYLFGVFRSEMESQRQFGLGHRDLGRGIGLCLEDLAKAKQKHFRNSRPRCLSVWSI